MNTTHAESLIMEYNMPGSNQSKRFSPSALTEKLIPALLVVLVLALLAVVIILTLSLVGIFPSAL